MKKNQVYMMSKNPMVVGVVKHMKCVRDNRWVIGATDGNEYVYNANTGSWSRGGFDFAKFEKLSESNHIA